MGLKDLKKTSEDAKTEEKVVAEKPQKEEKQKMSKEDLKALRIANLNKKERDPEVVKREEEATAAILAMVATGPKTTAELVGEILEATEDVKEKKDNGKFIRRLARKAGCQVTKMEGTRKVTYSAPPK